MGKSSRGESLVCKRTLSITRSISKDEFCEKNITLRQSCLLFETNILLHCGNAENAAGQNFAKKWKNITILTFFMILTRQEMTSNV
jgi:hypothetical protein